MYLLVFPNRDYAVGAAAGVMASTVAVLIAHPIESVKVRMQQTGTRGEGPFLRRVLDLLRKPYYGIGPHLLQYSALNSIRFGSFAAARGYFERRHAAAGQAKEQLTLGEVFLCGAFSGGCVAALLHPLWVLKTHQQANRLGMRDAAWRLYEGEGWRGFFRGYVSGFARFPLAIGIFFAAYDALKRPELWPRFLQRDREGCSAEAPTQPLAQAFGRATSGAVAGALCWTSIFPLDVVQSRIMGEANYGSARVYRSAFASFARIYREEGLASFGRGYSAILLRSGPANAVLLPVNDAAQPLADRVLPPER